MGRYYRNPKTLRTLKQAMPVDHEDPSVRIKAAKVPTSWDDFCRSDWNIRSWKRFRSHQYKVKEYAS